MIYLHYVNCAFSSLASLKSALVIQLLLHFAYPIQYDGTLNYVFCRAMQDANKNSLYVHEVFIAENIKKGDTLQTAAFQPHGGISLYRDILANILDSNSDKDTTISQNNNKLEEKVSENNENNSDNSISEQIKSAEKEVNTSPTDKQKEAGNYKKGHVQIGTFNITIEQPKGSVRSGVDANGRKWETTMHNTYGYIRGTEGVDGDHIDVFLSDDIDGWNGNNVFVVDQYNEDGTFDEHKVMLGFNTIEEAESAYLDNYEKGWEKKHKIVVSPIPTENFEKWIVSSHRKTKPFAEYKSVKSEENRTKNNENRTKNNENRTKSTENDSKVEESSVKDESKNKTIVEQSKKPSSKIEDFGEKIGGARKDVIRKYADKINVNGTTFGSMFPKPDIDKLIEAGLPIDRVAALKSVYDNAKHEFERSKKHRGKERALRETVFYAVFAKGILSGNEDFELHHEGLVFTEVGVKLVKANIAL